MIFFHDMAINLMTIAVIKKYDGVNNTTGDIVHAIIFIGAGGQVITDISHDDIEIRDREYEELMQIVKESAIHKLLNSCKENTI